MPTLGRIGYVNIFISDFDRSLSFYEQILGLEVLSRDEAFGYASFATEGASFAIARTDDRSLTGRHTGIGWVVDDVTSTYEALAAAGVEFEMLPSQQPWGGFMAMFKDPDGNLFYLDQIPAAEDAR
jgi:catechol 2,3-dioxygenase-like lactoylglutathione lyase family enzyme